MRTRILQIALVSSLAFGVSGCDFLYGVMRDAPIDTELSLDCVRQVVETTPGIEKVSYEARHDGKGLFHPEPWAYNYFYSGTPESHIVGNLQIKKEYDARLSYHDTLLAINQKPPQAGIDATRPVMKAMEARLAAQCGITELPARVKETCQGVICAPM